METTLEVTGMTCKNCEKAVKNALESLNGVSSVTVHLDQGQVEVSYEEAQVTVEALKQAVEDQGYDVA